MVLNIKYQKDLNLRIFFNIIIYNTNLNYKLYIFHIQYLLILFHKHNFFINLKKSKYRGFKKIFKIKLFIY